MTGGEDKLKSIGDLGQIGASLPGKMGRVVVEDRPDFSWEGGIADPPEARSHYNFARRHRGLKFGRELRTPAMQGP